MLFWTKLLTSAHAATSSIHPFLYLYYLHLLKFDIWTLGLLVVPVLILRVPASAFWIRWVDEQPSLQGVVTGLLTVIGTAGILLVLSIYPFWLAAALPAAIITSILDGLFYQPLEALVDSAIIKILGDYKILYENERRYGKYMMVMMSLTIGWSLNDDHDFDTLMVTILIGSMALFLLSLSTNVNQQLPPPDAVPDEESTLFICYKPYSLFREHLSHISEEVTTSIDTATRHNTTSHHNQKKLDVILSSASYQLARLPFPPPQSTVVVLMDLPTYYSEDEDDNRCAGSVVISFLCSTFMLGVVWGMSQTFVFVYLDSLNAPMHLIGAVGAVTVIADLLARLAILVAIHQRYRSWLMMAYGLLMSCLVLHVWLEPAKDVHQMILSMQFVILVLQLLQGLSFQLIWLLAAHQVDEVILSGYQRMMVKGGMAALYSSIGPAVGVLWMAYLVSSAHHYELVYQYAAGVTCLSAVLSWEWANYVY